MDVNCVPHVFPHFVYGSCYSVSEIRACGLQYVPHWLTWRTVHSRREERLQQQRQKRGSQQRSPSKTVFPSKTSQPDIPGSWRRIEMKPGVTSRQETPSGTCYPSEIPDCPASSCDPGEKSRRKCVCKSRDMIEEVIEEREYHQHVTSDFGNSRGEPSSACEIWYQLICLPNHTHTPFPILIHIYLFPSRVSMHLILSRWSYRLSFTNHFFLFPVECSCVPVLYRGFTFCCDAKEEMSYGTRVWHSFQSSQRGKTIRLKGCTASIMIIMPWSIIRWNSPPHSFGSNTDRSHSFLRIWNHNNRKMFLFQG